MNERYERAHAQSLALPCVFFLLTDDHITRLEHFVQKVRESCCGTKQSTRGIIFVRGSIKAGLLWLALNSSTVIVQRYVEISKRACKYNGNPASYQVWSLVERESIAFNEHLLKSSLYERR
eukprot:2547641-Pyramimonas_sp.AAC.1